MIEKKTVIKITKQTKSLCIRRVSLVTMPGSETLRRFEFPLDSLACWPGRYINVRPCGRLSMAPLQLNDIVKLFGKRREFLPGSEFLSHRDI